MVTETAAPDDASPAIAVPVPADAPAPAAAKVRPVARPDYTKPEWAGKPALQGGELAVELIVRGEVRRRIPLDTTEYDSFLIGRADICDVPLDGLEAKASRFHCVIQCKEGSDELYVCDLKSSHGTVLNGVRIDPHTFQPARVGSQLRFNADKQGPNDCIAVLCGPDEAMGEEKDIDLSVFREKAAQERQAQLRREQTDLALRKEAKKLRIYEEAQRKAVLSQLAARAQKKMDVLREAEAKDREKLHEVTWGFADDAVEAKDERQNEEVQKLMDSSGKLDLDKVRKLTLTEKQEAMCKKIEEKQRRANNLTREKNNIEERASTYKKRKKAAELDIDAFEDDGKGINLEKAASLEEKVAKAEEEINAQTDNLLLSLGLRKLGMSGRLREQRAAIYDTHNDDGEDDFFDRATSSTGGKKAAGPRAAEASELLGLPTLDRVENKASLESKVGLLGAEKVRLTAQIAGEKAKERQKATAAEAGGEDEDTLDAFMSGNLDDIRSDRRSKLEIRMAAVDTRLAEVEKLLRLARRNSDEPDLAPAAPSGASAMAAAAAAVAAKAAQAALAAAAGKASGSKASASAKDTADAAAKAGQSEAGVASTAPGSKRGPATSGGIAEALALLKEKGVKLGDTPKAVDSERADGAVDAAAASASGDAAGASGSSQRAKRGPERPPTGVLVASSGSKPPAARAAAEASAATAAAGTTMTTAAAVAAAETAAAARHRQPNARKVDVATAGLQMMAPTKRPGPTMPPLGAPPAKRVYGAPQRPTGFKVVEPARDAGMEDSGEINEPEG